MTPSETVEKIDELDTEARDLVSELNVEDVSDPDAFFKRAKQVAENLKETASQLDSFADEVDDYNTEEEEDEEEADEA